MKREMRSELLGMGLGCGLGLKEGRNKKETGE